jgi:eukaryotic-like serine/threonine-protein kinase
MLGWQEDAARYGVIRSMAVDRFAGTSRPVVAEQLLKACLLMPAPPEVVAKLRPLAERLETSVREGHEELAGNPSRVAWSGFALALLHHRGGDQAKAGEWLRICLREAGVNPSRDAAVSCLSAMIAARSGRDVQAAAELERARVAIETRFAEGLRLGNVNSFWFDWVNARVLLREASALVERPAEIPGKK